MKKAAGAIRLDLAQYREMEVFTQFASDLDEATQRQLIYGQGLMRTLRQEQYKPLRQHEQVIILVTVLGHLMTDIPVKEIPAVIARMLAWFDESHFEIAQEIEASGTLSDDLKERILAAAKTFLSDR